MKERKIKLGDVEYVSIESQVEAMGVSNYVNEKSATSYLHYHKKALGKPISIGRNQYFNKRKLVSVIQGYLAERVPKKATISSLPSSTNSKDVEQLITKVAGNPDLAKVLLELLS